MLNRLLQLIEQVAAIVRLPVVRLQFHQVLNPALIREHYRYYTKPHPRYKVFANKSIGAALVDLSRFHHRAAYDEEIKRHKEISRYVKRAKNKGYTVAEIDRNDFVDDIFAINHSVELRQGRPMDTAYQDKKTSYQAEANFKYYGVLDAARKLVAYGDVGFYGNFAAFSRVIGIRNNDGIVHLLVTDIIARLVDGGNCDYLMYDTYFGASPGLKKFKRMLGFAPYRAKYSIR